MTTPAELRNLLGDCLVLWGVDGRIVAAEDGLHLQRADGLVFTIVPGPDAAAGPVRWLLQTPARAAAGRGPRAAPSVVALLTALRAALDVPAGARLRIGAGAGMAS